MLRDRIARALPPGSAACPATTRCSACRRSAWRRPATTRAPRRRAARSVELEPRDGWGRHAVAHVMEMQNRRRDGIAWMRDNAGLDARTASSPCHNWWHLALFHLGLDQIDEVLALFDGPICGAALDRGARHDRRLGAAVAAAPARRRRRRPLGRAGRHAGRRCGGRQLRLQRHARDDGVRRRRPHAASRSGAGGAAARRAAEPATTTPRSRATSATPRRGRSRRSATATTPTAVQLLRPVRSIAHRFGGSHAQRDLLDLTLIEAALRRRPAAGRDRARRPSAWRRQADQFAGPPLRAAGGRHEDCGVT